MASAYAALGKARRKQSKISREKAIGMEAISTAGEVATFAAGQAEKSKTAWKEYEAGYEALGGDKADIPKRGGFWKQLGQTLMPGGDKGFFQMPEGEVQIDDRMYDMEKIQEAGSFLGSNAAAILDEGTRGNYLKRTVPGREIPSYARGGDFITNGPQKILVGDNASGRERVTIKPLPSTDDNKRWRENYPDDNGQYDKNYMEALDRNRKLHSWRT